MKNTLLLLLIPIILGCNTDNEEKEFFLNIDIDKIEATDKGGEFYIQIISNTAWDIINNSSWINSYRTETINANACRLKINIHQNNTYNKRDAIIIIKSRNITRNISIIQKQNSVIITDKNIYEFDYKGGTKDVSYKSNIETQILVIPENNWIHVNESVKKTKSLSDYNINIMVDSNRGNSREATLIIYGEDEKKEIKIKQEEFIPLESIQFEEGNELFISNLNEVILHPILLPSNCSNKDITWHSSNPATIEVYDTGKIKIHKNGEAYIYAKNEESNIESTIVITAKIKSKELFVKGYEEYYINNGSMILGNLSHSFRLSIKTAPIIAYKNDITIKSSDSSLASIDKGYVICNNTKEGIVRITVTDEYSKIMTSFNIDIKKRHLFAGHHRIEQLFDGFNMSFAGKILSVSPYDKFKVLGFYLMDHNGLILTFEGEVQNNNTNEVTFITKDINITKTHGISVLTDEAFALMSQWKIFVSYVFNNENKSITESVNIEAGISY